MIVRLTPYESQLLLEDNELPARIREQVRAAMMAGKFAALELSRYEAIAIGNSLTDSFASVGFGESPDTTPNGYRINDLIDKFLGD